MKAETEELALLGVMRPGSKVVATGHQSTLESDFVRSGAIINGSGVFVEGLECLPLEQVDVHTMEQLRRALRSAAVLLERCVITIDKSLGPLNSHQNLWRTSHLLFTLLP